MLTTSKSSSYGVHKDVLFICTLLICMVIYVCDRSRFIGVLRIYIACPDRGSWTGFAEYNQRIQSQGSDAGCVWVRMRQESNGYTWTWSQLSCGCGRQIYEQAIKFRWAESICWIICNSCSRVSPSSLCVEPVLPKISFKIWVNPFPQDASLIATVVLVLRSSGISRNPEVWMTCYWHRCIFHLVFRRQKGAFRDMVTTLGGE